VDRIVAGDGQDTAVSQPEEKLLRLTQAMLAAAENRDWDGLAGIEAERRRLVSLLFDPPASPRDAAATAECIRRMLDLDRRTIAIAETGLRDISSELANVERARRAHRAYGDHAS
jgi:hypothetical protein